MDNNKLAGLLSEEIMLDAHQLNIFLTAAETLNFTKAAERLHMSQPSVSQHIHSLEKHFDEVLFIRQGRSMILSDAGRMLIPLARQFVKQSTRISETMASLKGQIQGRITIGCNAVAGKFILPEYFHQFHDEFQGVTIACQTDKCNMPQEALRSGNLHFLFTTQTQGLEPCLEVSPVVTEELRLITPKDHPWAGEDHIEPKKLLTEKFILPSENTDTYQRVNGALASHNLSLLQLDSFLTFDNEEAIVMSVQKGLGVSFSSSIITSTFGSVRSIPIKGVEILRTISIVRDKSQLSTGARDAFWHFMTSISDKIKQRINT
jgi:DNA-binding transcriptional LysR family regulator